MVLYSQDSCIFIHLVIFSLCLILSVLNFISSVWINFLSAGELFLLSMCVRMYAGVYVMVCGCVLVVGLCVCVMLCVMVCDVLCVCVGVCVLLPCQFSGFLFVCKFFFWPSLKTTLLSSIYTLLNSWCDWVLVYLQDYTTSTTTTV